MEFGSSGRWCSNSDARGALNRTSLELSWRPRAAVESPLKLPGAVLADVANDSVVHRGFEITIES